MASRPTKTTLSTTKKAKPARATPAVTQKRESRPRSTRAGDIAPSSSAKGIKKFAVTKAVDAARESKIVAVKDILAGASLGDTAALAKTLEAIMAGASPDDAAVLRNALMKQGYSRTKNSLSVPMMSLQMTGVTADIPINI